MPLPEASVAALCRSVKEFVKANLQVGTSRVDVIVGAPASATAGQGATHRLNLFFDRFDPPGFFPDSLPGDTWRLRMHCLATAFGVTEEGIGAGENDLRIVGDVIRLFNENPVLPPFTFGNETVRLEVVQEPVTLEAINQLWSTQKEIAYRPSVAYQMSLVPVPPLRPALGGPVVGMLGLEVRGNTGAAAPFAGTPEAPDFVPARIDTADEAWAPQICFYRGEACHEVLSFRVGTAQLGSFTPRVVVAGKVGSSVTLQWEAWDAEVGWRPMPPTAQATIHIAAIDPASVPSSARTSIALPFKDRPGQAMLYAVRRYRRAADGPSGAEVEVRSNPVLVILRGAA